MITFEYPLSERVRTLLRLEDLFDKITHFAASDGPLEHHVALGTLFEILEVASRADLKFDLVQELERQRQILLSFRNNPDISEEALDGALYEIEQASSQLLAMQGKIGHYLRENDWLMSIKNRAAIPGGVCEFDLPGYHYWLHRDTTLRQRDIEGWITPLLPIRDGLAIVLRLLRSSGRPESQTAPRGAYQTRMIRNGPRRPSCVGGRGSAGAAGSLASAPFFRSASASRRADRSCCCRSASSSSSCWR